MKRERTPMILQITKNDKDVFELINFIAQHYPLHVTQPKRIKEVIDQINFDNLTVIVEENYIDKQYRDCYYSYYSQKYCYYERECVRLTFFDEKLDNDDLIEKDDAYLTNHLVGTIVLRPLHIGNIGLTLLNPRKLKVDGYIRVAEYTFMTFGRKLCVSAFPFSSQDGDVMTCAENALYNLINYYGTRYSDYRAFSPGEISSHLEVATSERVFPSGGVRLLDLAKVLERAHLYPTLYKYDQYEDSFDDIMISYCESGIPFLFAAFHHVVTCIGFEEIQGDCQYEVSHFSKDNETYYLLSAAQFIKSNIFMDDNKYPYSKSTLKDLASEYYEFDDTDYESENGDEENGPRNDPEERYIITENTLANVDMKDVALIVPLHKRIYLEATHAREIFFTHFLLNKQFVTNIQKEYSDNTWGTQENNPLVYRFFLTTARNYKSFKREHEQSSDIRTNIILNPFPHFIWIMEISTSDLFKEKKGCVEIILDASSSFNSQENAILSIRYYNHYLFTPDIIELMNEPVPTSYSTPGLWDNMEKDFQNQALTTMFEVLYTDKNTNSNVSATFDMFSEYNLERM